MKRNGFTLVELMVVIVIIGILAALAIPKFMSATNKSKVTEFKPILKQIYTLQTAYLQEHDAYGLLSKIGFDPPSSAARFDYQEPTKGSPPSKAISVNSSIGVAKVKSSVLLKASGASGGEILLKAGVDDACINDQGVMYAQSTELGGISSLEVSGTFATCSP